MLQIDYSLVPLAPEDVERVQREVLRRIQTGQVPPLERSVAGRMVLVNPDPVQTVHQIPDDLRPRLRRVLLPTQEGSTHLPADVLFRQIVESDERLYLLVIELQSEFRALNAFLDYLPQLRERYPGLGIFLSGTIPDLMAKFHQILGEGNASLLLRFPDARGTVEIEDSAKLKEMISPQDEAVTLGSPFFSQIRLVLEKDGKPVAFNVDNLRMLHPVFGHGEPVEVQVGGGRKERMHIVDLPMRVVRDFQFRPDRGMEFYGVIMGGQLIPSHQFSEKKLEYRWVPVRSVEAFLRRRSGAEVEKVETAKVKLLRVNCFNGQVSFILDPAGDRISFASIHSVSLRRRQGAAPSANHANHEDDAAQGPNGAEPAEEEIVFDRVIRPQSFLTHQDPMQEAVREHFYGSLIREGIVQSRKLELYAQRLKAGAVGPLTGQTLKLLRRFGLEELIAPESFYYLCDEPGELPGYHRTQERFEEHFGNLLELLRGLAAGEPSKEVRVGDVAYRMPISTEWVDTGLADFSKASPQELEAVYHEMAMLLSFIAHEFQRNFDIAQNDLSFFAKIQDCRTAGLLAKWMSEVKQGAYGKLLAPEQYPDVVFYATEEDKRMGDGRHRFPSLACAELFQERANRNLFRTVDYDFSVFLEEQLALGVHEAREAGHFTPGMDELQGYLTRKLDETHEQIRHLGEAVASFDDTNSPVYKQLLQQEEEAYHQRHQEFQQDLARVHEELANINQRYEALVAELQPHLDAVAGEEPDYFADDPQRPERREARILRAAEKGDERGLARLREQMAELFSTFGDWTQVLESVPASLGRLLKHQQAWEQALEARLGAGLGAEWAQKVEERMTHLQRFNPPEREGHARRVAAQQRNLETELRRFDQHVAQQRRNLQRAVASLHSFVGRTKQRMETMRLDDDDDEFNPDQRLTQSENFRESLTEIARTARGLAGKAGQMVEALEQARVRKQRYTKHLRQIRLENAVLKALAEKQHTVPPPEEGPAGALSEAALGKLRTQWEGYRDRLREVPEQLTRLENQAQEQFRLNRGHTAEYRRLHDKFERLAKISSRRRRLRESAKGLEERQVLMEEELADLPQRVSQRFMPARKKLLVEVFIPAEEKRDDQFRRAQAFVKELLSLAPERIQSLYLERSIYRRFYSAQFVRGWHVAPDPAHPAVQTLRNIAPAIKVLLRTFRHNFMLNGRDEAMRLSLEHFPSWSVRELLERVESLSRLGPGAGTDYIVLPATLALRDAVTLINRKDVLFNGVPRLAMLYVTKFDPKPIREDSAFREAYFKAMRHNVIVNVDGHEVVDNPKAIADRLLTETLGCAIDLPRIETLSQDEALLDERD